jgi:hypothetical protein
MSGVWLKFGTDRLPVRARIFGGFAVVLMLLGALAATMLGGTGTVETQSDHVEDSAKVAALVGAFANQAEEARTRVIAYTLSENDGDLQSAEQSLARLRDAAAAIGGIERSSDHRCASMTQIAEQQTNYDDD